MNTVLCHFYNEEYLLPWWLNHHKKMFDHGIMIDYHSTDNSREIIKKICPSWDILTSRNLDFEAVKVDEEVFDIEKNLDGWRICLNITEFLLGDISKLKQKNDEDIFIDSMTMVDKPDEEFVEPDPKLCLLTQRTFGIYPTNIQENIYAYRALRRMSKIAKPYTVGRHYYNCKIDADFLIACYYYSPYTENLIKRKIQIGDRIPECDKLRNFGWQHLNLDKQILYTRMKDTQSKSRDLISKIQEKLKT